jgi:hypothetical protein
MVGNVHTVTWKEQYTQQLGENTTLNSLEGNVHKGIWREKYTQLLGKNRNHSNL